jgi:hypothetical protein
VSQTSCKRDLFHLLSYLVFLETRADWNLSLLRLLFILNDVLLVQVG